jgi:hypothetical protein
MFNSTGPHYCPTCPPTFRRPKDKPPVRVGERLELTESNYSGCGVDITYCPKCGKGFQISYQVKAITELGPEWGPAQPNDR